MLTNSPINFDQQLAQCNRVLFIKKYNGATLEKKVNLQRSYQKRPHTTQAYAQQTTDADATASIALRATRCGLQPAPRSNLRAPAPLGGASATGPTLSHKSARLPRKIRFLWLASLFELAYLWSASHKGASP